MLRRLRPLTTLLGLVLLTANAASALAHASAENCASGFAVSIENRSGQESRLSEGAVWESVSPDYDLVSDSPVAARGTTTVIGRTKDLGNLAKGERSLLDRLTPDLGSAKANWARNSGVLREEMGRGLPIRDLSPGNTAGEFLNAERALLRDRGWTFNPQTNFWMPPLP